MKPSETVVVVGAGHAGCEAAVAVARLGGRAVVVTLSRSTVAQMPCNPAIGGIGKGHLVAEIDALGGLQGWAADRAGIQFRVLNRSRGPAVWGPRAQCDKAAYSRRMLRVVERFPGVTLVEGEAVGLAVNDSRVVGVRLADGRIVDGRAVILTTGTFLGGLLHTGGERQPGGRYGEAPSVGLGGDLVRLGFELRRFKTGTPPRLHRDSLELERLDPQQGDAEPRPFSWRTRAVANRVQCWVTRTPPEIRALIEDNLHRSPLFSGEISGVGPRYCPSIEDKVVRFPHHETHTVFLEPETLAGPSMYVNGLSTSLPRDVQERIVRSVRGLERARFLRYGYAVEYDVISAGQVGRTLATRDMPGLFVAGQLLGTSGYEEAAALGLVAGINAAREVRGLGAWVPDRSEAYVGVLLDDLCGREHREPYRMFTSRAEHRLLLGVDSARERLMAEGHRLGLVPETAFHVEQSRWRRRRVARQALEATPLNPDRQTRARVRTVAGVDIVTPTTWAQLLRRQDVDPQALVGRLPQLSDLDPADRMVVVGELRYDGYRQRHEREHARLKRLAGRPLPTDLEPGAIPGLSREVVEALTRERPQSLAEAERVPGMTPAALAILAGWMSKVGTRDR